MGYAQVLIQGFLRCLPIVVAAECSSATPGSSCCLKSRLEIPGRRSSTPFDRPGPQNVRSLENFEAILKISDGIVIDRGYLGAEVEVELVTTAQKQIIATVG